MPFRFLRQSVGLAVRSVRAGVGNTVRFVWPRSRKRRSRSTPKHPSAFLDRWNSTVANSPFKDELCTEGSRDYCQSLMTVGSRHWGRWWDGGGVLNVKLYEFAVYIDQPQMRRSSLARVLHSDSETLQTNRRFLHQLRNSDEFDMSIVVKASRNLPLQVMSSEYEKVLKRRILRVGGRTDDPSLPRFLSIFNPERLPSQLHDGQNNVKRGSTMRFQRRRDGTLTTYANNQKVSEVKSKALCSALFDLYIGDEPVSLEARTLGVNRLLDMMTRQEAKRSTCTSRSIDAPSTQHYSASLF